MNLGKKRRYRTMRVLLPGEMPGLQDQEITNQRLNDEIRRLESTKVGPDDVPGLATVENESVTLFASGARTATNNSNDQKNTSYKRLLLIFNVTATGGGSFTPSLQIKDSLSGNYVTIWTADQPITAVGQYTYYFADGGGGGSFTGTGGFGLPAVTWRVRAVHNNASSITYSGSGDTLT